MREQDTNSEVAPDMENAEAWWESISENPMKAIRSPLFALLTLESPERWSHLEYFKADSWITDVLIHERHSQRFQDIEQLWAADCLEHILPLFEAEYPDDLRVRQCIDARRVWARGEISDDEFLVYQKLAQAAGGRAKNSTIRKVGTFPGSVYHPPSAGEKVADAVAFGNSYNATHSARWVSVTTCREEAVWQFRLLMKYLM